MNLRLAGTTDSVGRSRFGKVAELLHRDEPAFVPPFPGSISKFLKPDSAVVGGEQVRTWEIYEKSL